MKKARGQPGCADPQTGRNVTIVYATGEIPTTVSGNYLRPQVQSFPSILL
jgi:hypothetical protein